jgi:hypothetical protein
MEHEDNLAIVCNCLNHNHFKGDHFTKYILVFCLVLLIFEHTNMVLVLGILKFEHTSIVLILGPCQNFHATLVLILFVSKANFDLV